AARIDRARADLGIARERSAIQSARTTVTAFLSAGQHRKAIETLDRLAASQKAWFEHSDLPALRDRAKQELAQQLTAEGRAMLTQARLQTATAKLQEAR